MVLGAVGPAKNNAARRCVVGNFLCIKAVGNDGSVPKAAVGVYGDETDAQAVAAFVEDPSDVSLKSAHDDAITRELHEESEVPLSILKAMAANSPASSLSSLCRCHTIPPFLQLIAWLMVKRALHPSHLSHKPIGRNP